MSKAIGDVAGERFRQIYGEGFDETHDDRFRMGQLIDAAWCYLGAFHDNAAQPSNWPWLSKWWKPKDRRRNLVRAAALIIAEIDRLDRECGVGKEGEQT